MAKDLQKDLQVLLDEKMIRVAKDDKGGYYCIVEESGGNAAAFPLYENDFRKALKKIYYNRFGEVLSVQEVQSAVEIIEIIGTDTTEEVEVCKRIFNNSYQYAYELNREEGTVVWIEDGEVSIEKTSGIIFRHAANYANQIEPNLKVQPEKLLNYMRKHFNLSSDREVKLLTLYLVTSLWGLRINHPILVLTGEKGSSKSSSFKKLEELIDPKSSELGSGIPRGSDGLEVRLYNGYFVTFDNLSSLSRKISDILAVAVTGGSFSKRALYRNADEIVLDLKAVVAVNGVSLVAKESDLLDRSVILTLRRITPDKVLTEEELWAEFEKDRPKMLGACFNVLAAALNDTEEVRVRNKIRMADFHVACVKVGRVLGIPEEEVSDILWENQKNINQRTLDEDVVALCVIELMQGRKEYVNSMSGLLIDLLDVADSNGMPPTVIPKTANHLRSRLDKTKSNLQSEYGITYHVKNIGTFKEITIKKSKKLAKVATAEEC